MTTPHEAVVMALTYITTPDGKLAKDQYYGLDNVTYESIATAAIEALREGATLRLAALSDKYDQQIGQASYGEIVDAILGPPADKS